MKFWQKTFLLTLALFLVCLNGGIFALTYYTYREAVMAEEATGTEQYLYIARTLDHNLRLFTGDHEELMLSAYADSYRTRDTNLMLTYGDKTVYTSFGTVPAHGENAISQTRWEGKRYLLIEGEIGDTGYRLLFGKDVSGLDVTFRKLLWVFLGISAMVSLFLAVGLYWLLKGLSAPLEDLQKTAETISAGDLSMEAKEKGKDEFASLARSFNTMVHKLRAQMEELERDAEQKQMLVNNMAHELRTPLTGIRGYAQFIERAAASDEVKTEAAKCIDQEAERLEKISAKLLDTAYLQAESIQKEEVDLPTLLLGTAARLKSLAEKKGAELVCDPTPCKVMGDGILLSLLVDNLAENALKADSTQVTLACGAGKITVTDNGRGMTEEQLAQITKPFYRTDKNRSRSEGGAGLGLALCKQIVDSHGGELSFSSEYEKGTTATVLLKGVTE